MLLLQCKIASEASVHTLHTFTTKLGLHPISSKAVDRHNIIEGSALRDEELNIQTLIFHFPGLLFTT